MVVLELEEDVVANITAIPNISAQRQHQQRLHFASSLSPHAPRGSSPTIPACLQRSSTRPKHFTCSLLSSLTSLAEYLIKCYIKALREGEGKGVQSLLDSVQAFLQWRPRYLMKQKQ
jgi:hypothetical protein